MRVAASAAVGVIELVVGPPGAADFVVDGTGEPWRHWLAGFSSQYTGAVYRCGLTSAASGNVCPVAGAASRGRLCGLRGCGPVSRGEFQPTQNSLPSGSCMSAKEDG